MPDFLQSQIALARGGMVVTILLRLIRQIRRVFFFNWQHFTCENF
jgi:hypoxanthine phosphoribosyltransferase